MKFNGGCLKPLLVTLAIGMSLLAACTMVSSERVIGVCPPVVEYNGGFQARAAEELQTLPDGSAALEMLSDYAVMREQARLCYRNGPANG